MILPRVRYSWASILFYKFYIGWGGDEWTNQTKMSKKWKRWRMVVVAMIASNKGMKEAFSPRTIWNDQIVSHFWDQFLTTYLSFFQCDVSLHQKPFYKSALLGDYLSYLVFMDWLNWNSWKWTSMCKNV